MTRKKETAVNHFYFLFLFKKKCFFQFFFRHLLVVFGGLQGLEASVDTDQNLEVTDPSVLFDLYLNTCPSQGSRTIRTEVRNQGTKVALVIHKYPDNTGAESTALHCTPLVLPDK